MEALPNSSVFPNTNSLADSARTKHSRKEELPQLLSAQLIAAVLLRLHAGKPLENGLNILHVLGPMPQPVPRRHTSVARKDHFLPLQQTLQPDDFASALSHLVDPDKQPDADSAELDGKLRLFCRDITMAALGKTWLRPRVPVTRLFRNISAYSLKKPAAELLKPLQKIMKDLEGIANAYPDISAEGPVETQHIKLRLESLSREFHACLKTPSIENIHRLSAALIELVFGITEDHHKFKTQLEAAATRNKKEKKSETPPISEALQHMLSLQNIVAKFDRLLPPLVILNLLAQYTEYAVLSVHAFRFLSSAEPVTAETGKELEKRRERILDNINRQSGFARPLLPLLDWLRQSLDTLQHTLLSAFALYPDYRNHLVSLRQLIVNHRFLITASSDAVTNWVKSVSRHMITNFIEAEPGLKDPARKKERALILAHLEEHLVVQTKHQALLEHTIEQIKNALLEPRRAIPSGRETALSRFRRSNRENPPLAEESLIELLTRLAKPLNLDMPAFSAQAQSLAILTLCRELDNRGLTWLAVRFFQAFILFNNPDKSAATLMEIRPQFTEQDERLFRFLMGQAISVSQPHVFRPLMANTHAITTEIATTETRKQETGAQTKQHWWNTAYFLNKLALLTRQHLFSLPFQPWIESLVEDIPAEEIFQSPLISSLLSQYKTDYRAKNLIDSLIRKHTDSNSGKNMPYVFLALAVQSDRKSIPVKLQPVLQTIEASHKTLTDTITRALSFPEQSDYPMAGSHWLAASVETIIRDIDALLLKYSRPFLLTLFRSTVFSQLLALLAKGLTKKLPEAYKLFSYLCSVISYSPSLTTKCIRTLFLPLPGESVPPYLDDAISYLTTSMTESDRLVLYQLRLLSRQYPFIPDIEVSHHSLSADKNALPSLYMPDVAAMSPFIRLFKETPDLFQIRKSDSGGRIPVSTPVLTTKIRAHRDRHLEGYFYHLPKPVREIAYGLIRADEEHNPRLLQKAADQLYDAFLKDPVLPPDKERLLNVILFSYILLLPCSDHALLIALCDCPHLPDFVIEQYLLQAQPSLLTGVIQNASRMQTLCRLAEVLTLENTPFLSRWPETGPVLTAIMKRILPSRFSFSEEAVSELRQARNVSLNARSVAELREYGKASSDAAWRSSETASEKEKQVNAVLRLLHDKNQGRQLTPEEEAIDLTLLTTLMTEGWLNPGQLPDILEAYSPSAGKDPLQLYLAHYDDLMTMFRRGYLAAPHIMPDAVAARFAEILQSHSFLIKAIAAAMPELHYYILAAAESKALTTSLKEPSVLSLAKQPDITQAIKKYHEALLSPDLKWEFRDYVASVLTPEQLIRLLQLMTPFIAPFHQLFLNNTPSRETTLPYAPFKKRQRLILTIIGQLCLSPQSVRVYRNNGLLPALYDLHQAFLQKRRSDLKQWKDWTERLQAAILTGNKPDHDRAMLHQLLMEYEAEWAFSPGMSARFRALETAADHLAPWLTAAVELVDDAYHHYRAKDRTGSATLLYKTLITLLSSLIITTVCAENTVTAAPPVQIARYPAALRYARKHLMHQPVDPRFWGDRFLRWIGKDAAGSFIFSASLSQLFPVKNPSGALWLAARCLRYGIPLTPVYAKKITDALLRETAAAGPANPPLTLKELTEAFRFKHPSRLITLIRFILRPAKTSPLITLAAAPETLLNWIADDLCRELETLPETLQPILVETLMDVPPVARRIADIETHTRSLPERLTVYLEHQGCPHTDPARISRLLKWAMLNRKHHWIEYIYNHHTNLIKTLFSTLITEKDIPADNLTANDIPLLLSSPGITPPSAIAVILHLLQTHETDLEKIIEKILRLTVLHPFFLFQSPERETRQITILATLLTGAEIEYEMETAVLSLIRDVRLPHRLRYLLAYYLLESPSGLKAETILQLLTFLKDMPSRLSFTHQTSLANACFDGNFDREFLDFYLKNEKAGHDIIQLPPVKKALNSLFEFNLATSLQAVTTAEPAWKSLLAATMTASVQHLHSHPFPGVIAFITHNRQTRQNELQALIEEEAHSKELNALASSLSVSTDTGLSVPGTLSLAQINPGSRHDLIHNLPLPEDKKEKLHALFFQHAYHTSGLHFALRLNAVMADETQRHLLIHILTHIQWTHHPFMLENLLAHWPESDCPLLMIRTALSDHNEAERLKPFYIALQETLSFWLRAGISGQAAHIPFIVRVLCRYAPEQEDELIRVLTQTPDYWKSAESLHALVTLLNQADIPASFKTSLLGNFLPDAGESVTLHLLNKLTDIPLKLLAWQHYYGASTSGEESAPASLANTVNYLADALETTRLSLLDQISPLLRLQDIPLAAAEIASTLSRKLAAEKITQPDYTQWMTTLCFTAVRNRQRHLIIILLYILRQAPALNLPWAWYYRALIQLAAPDRNYALHMSLTHAPYFLFPATLYEPGAKPAHGICDLTDPDRRSLLPALSQAIRTNPDRQSLTVALFTELLRFSPEIIAQTLSRLSPDTLYPFFHLLYDGRDLLTGDLKKQWAAFLKRLYHHLSTHLTEETAAAPFFWFIYALDPAQADQTLWQWADYTNHTIKHQADISHTLQPHLAAIQDLFSGETPLPEAFDTLFAEKSLSLKQKCLLIMAITRHRPGLLHAWTRYLILNRAQLKTGAPSKDQQFIALLLGAEGA